MKPLIFSGPSIQAILDGRKNMTRRVMKPQNVPCYSCGEIKGYWLDNKPYWEKKRINKEDCTNTLFCSCCNDQIEYKRMRGVDEYKIIPSPYIPNDVLWVREKWRRFSGMQYCWQGGAYIPAYDFEGINYATDDLHMRNDEGNILEMFLPSGDVKTDIDYEAWRSPIHMPRAAARLFLRVTDVRVERLQDISEEDAIAEGANYKNERNVGFEEKMQRSAIDRYRETWDAINAKSGNTWESNPWVWVYTFERIEEEEKSDENHYTVHGDN